MSDDRGHPTATRSVPLLVAAAAVVVAVVVLVLVFGIARPPALDPLGADPALDPGAGVAWTVWSRDGHCLHVARPDGRIDDLGCVQDGGDLVGWDDGVLALRTWGETGDMLLLLDDRTGTVVERRRIDAEIFEEAVPTTAMVDRRDGRLVVRVEGTVVWEVDADSPYGIRRSVRSPDGRWLAMVDSADRLLVVPTDGSQSPLIWVDDLAASSRLVWEGTPWDE